MTANRLSSKLADGLLDT